MKSIFEEMAVHIVKYGRMRRSYLKEHRKILYNNYVLEGNAVQAICLRLIKPATSAWKSSFLLWQSKRA